MFTGIIEEIGIIDSIMRGSRSAVLRVRASKVLDGTAVGDSIAVNGVCLTVSALHSGAFSSDAMPETLARSALGSLRPGSQVNLERALAAGGRFGGHIVQGHVDATGRILGIRQDDNAYRIIVGTDPGTLRYIVGKGSIAINGVSLTVSDVSASSFEVSVIPHTAASTTLLMLRSGDAVNLETDIIGRYVERFLSLEKGSGGITEEMLRRCGF